MGGEAITKIPSGAGLRFPQVRRAMASKYGLHVCYVDDISRMMNSSMASDPKASCFLKHATLLVPSRIEADSLVAPEASL